MQTVQVAITSAICAEKARKALDNDANWRVSVVDTPDPDQGGVVLMDQCAFDKMSSPLREPWRVVLITRNDPLTLARAWDAGIISAVLETDSAETLLLAVQSAALRATARTSSRGIPCRAM
jgi:DNA-binding NarL/FixJ family response regulator